MADVAPATELVGRIRREWPAALAVLTLALGHAYFAIVLGEELTLLGIPLFLAVLVFFLGELIRRVGPFN